MTLTRAAQYESMFSFKYSPRPNTLASKRLPETVTPEEKTARIVALQALQREIQTAIHESAVGTDVDVLVDSVGRRADGELSGRTMGNTVVNFQIRTDTPAEPTSWIGRTVRVRVTRGGPHSLRGEALPFWRFGIDSATGPPPC